MVVHTISILLSFHTKTLLNTVKVLLLVGMIFVYVFKSKQIAFINQIYSLYGNHQNKNHSVNLSSSGAM